MVLSNRIGNPIVMPNYRKIRYILTNHQQIHRVGRYCKNEHFENSMFRRHFMTSSNISEFLETDGNMSEILNDFT